MAGDRHSQMDRTLSELTQSLPKGISQSLPKGAVRLRNSPRPYQIGSPFLLVQYSELDQPLVQKSISESDCLIFERLMDFEELEWALQLAEEGRMVIIHLATSSLISLLHRVFSSFGLKPRRSTGSGGLPTIFNFVQSSLSARDWSFIWRRRSSRKDLDLGL